MVSGEHLNLDKLTSTSLMLPKDENGDGTRQAVPSRASNHLGKILIREDTILGGIQGCTSCGKAQLTCGGVNSQWSALCWGKRSEKKYACMILALLATFMLSLIGTISFCFTNILTDVILSNMVLKNNSMAYKMWQKPTVQPLCKVHLFNYTNVDRVLAGLDQKLRVDEVGPYVYSQSIERVNVKFGNGDSTLTFQEKNSFNFQPNESTGVEYDQVIVPNLPLLGLVSKAVYLPSVVQVSLAQTISWGTNNPKPFLRLPVSRFLWGYKDTIMDVAKSFLSIQGKMRYTDFGLLASKNGTASERVTINTGEKNMDRINFIERVDGETELGFWGTKECNSIEATDGTLFPPSLLDRRSTLYIFNQNICRRLPFLYQEDIETDDGIQLLRYRMPLDIFEDPKHNTANQCFCHLDSGVCPPRGVVNVSACALGVPALVSFPHFYLGDQSVIDAVEGLKPDPEKHTTYIDIHPKLGIVIGGKSSLQINMQVKKSAFFPSLSHLEQDLILPVAWIETTVGKLPDGIRALIYHGTYSTAAMQLGLSWGCGIAMLCSGAALAMLMRRRKPRPCVILKKLPDTELKTELQVLEFR